RRQSTGRSPKGLASSTAGKLHLPPVVETVLRSSLALPATQGIFFKRRSRTRTQPGGRRQGTSGLIPHLVICNSAGHREDLHRADEVQFSRYLLTASWSSALNGARAVDANIGGRYDPPAILVVNPQGVLW